MFNPNGVYNSGSMATKVPPYDGEDFDARILDAVDRDKVEVVAQTTEVASRWAEQNKRLDALRARARAGKKALAGMKEPEQHGGEAETSRPEEVAQEEAVTGVVEQENTEQEDVTPGVLSQEEDDDARLTRALAEEVAKDDADESTEEVVKSVVGDKISGVQVNSAQLEKVMRTRREMKNADAGVNSNELLERLRVAEAEIEEKNRTIVELKGKLRRRGVIEGMFSAAGKLVTEVTEKYEAWQAEREARRSAKLEAKQNGEVDSFLKEIYEVYDRLEQLGDKSKGQDKARFVKAMVLIRDVALEKTATRVIESAVDDGDEEMNKVAEGATLLLKQDVTYASAVQFLNKEEPGWEDGLSEYEKLNKVSEVFDKWYLGAAEIGMANVMEEIWPSYHNINLALVNSRNDLKMQQRVDAAKDAQITEAEK